MTTTFQKHPFSFLTSFTSDSPQYRLNYLNNLSCENGKIRNENLFNCAQCDSGEKLFSITTTKTYLRVVTIYESRTPESSAALLHIYVTISLITLIL